MLGIPRPTRKDFMRIISGRARGRKLAEFPGQRIRPTSDRVREALFSILTSRIGSISGLHVLDLYAGTGAFSFEAISRGAEMAVLVEDHPDSLKLIQANADACRMSRDIRVIRGRLPEIPSGLLPLAPFDIIFLDPPYQAGLGSKTLDAIAGHALLAEDGMIVVESAEKEELPATAGDLEQTDRRVYGATALTFYERMTPQG